MLAPPTPDQSVTDDLFAVAAAFNPLRAAESAAVGHRTGPYPVADTREAAKALNAQLAPCHGLRHDASQSGVGRGGIEPPTPGFSIRTTACPLVSAFPYIAYSTGPPAAL